MHVYFRRKSFFLKIITETIFETRRVRSSKKWFCSWWEGRGESPKVNFYWIQWTSKAQDKLIVIKCNRAIGPRIYWCSEPHRTYIWVWCDHTSILFSLNFEYSISSRIRKLPSKVVLVIVAFLHNALASWICAQLGGVILLFRDRPLNSNYRKKNYSAALRREANLFFYPPPPPRLNGWSLRLIIFNSVHIFR